MGSTVLKRRSKIALCAAHGKKETYEAQYRKIKRDLRNEGKIPLYCIECGRLLHGSNRSGKYCVLHRKRDHKARYLKSRDRVLEYKRTIYRERGAINAKRWRAENREKYKEMRGRYYSKYKDRILADRREEAKTQEFKDRRNAAARARYNESPISKALISIRSRTRAYINKTNHKPSKRSMRLIGCTPLELKLHLENQFYPHPNTNEPMSWDNYGKKWDVDHWFPLAVAAKESQESFEAACHYANLRPLWKEENMAKGAKIPD